MAGSVAPSVLEILEKKDSVSPSFCIKSEYCICINCIADRKKVEPPDKKRRFAAPCSDLEMQDLAKGKKSINTQKNTEWGVRVFTEWAHEGNAISSFDDQVPEGFLDQNYADNTEPLNKWLSFFVCEVRNKNGKPYPPSSIHSILAALLRYMRDKNPETPDFLTKNDWRFKKLNGVKESVFVDLRKQGIGCEVKHTPTISLEEETCFGRKEYLE